MRICYYPGCSLESTGRAFNQSVQATCAALNVELVEPPDWVCCGSSAAYKTDQLLSVALAAQNINLASSAGFDEMVTPCPYCFRRLKSADDAIEHDGVLRQDVETALDERYHGGVTIHNMLGLLRYGVGLDAIRARVTRPLHGLRVVAYYGCALTRPQDSTGYDHPENPQSLDDILLALGAEVLDWNYKTECCGAGLSIPRADVVLELGSRIVEQARLAGADAIILACQLCQANLDTRQRGMVTQGDRHLPVLYFTQLMGLAFGLPEQALGLRHHLVDPRPLLDAFLVGGRA